MLVAPRVLAALDQLVEAEPLGELVLRGFLRPLAVFNVVRLKA